MKKSFCELSREERPAAPVGAVQTKKSKRGSSGVAIDAKRANNEESSLRLKMSHDDYGR
jgi:hypothetical protein